MPVMTRVTHILRSLDPGGAEKMVLDLAALQAGSGGIEPDILCMQGPGPLAEKAREAGIPCRVAGMGGLRYLSPALRVRRLLAGGTRPDLVHTHNLVAQIHGAPAARSLGIPVVHTKHGRSVTSFRRAPFLRRIVYGMASRVAVVSRETGESFRLRTGLGPERVEVIYNGIRSGDFGRADRAEARRGLGLPEGATVFGSVSRLDPVKNHPLMLEAFARVRGEDAAFFLVAGDGPERGRIEGIVRRLGIEDSVVMAGYREDVDACLAAMDLFLQPSSEEGLSLTILEAAASGTPVVASRVGGNPEIIEDGVSGVLVEPGDVDALEAAMKEFLARPGRFEEMAAAAERIVAERFSLAAMERGYRELYRSVLGRGE